MTVETYTVDASLQVEYFFNQVSLRETVVPSGEISVTINTDTNRPTHSDTLKTIADQMGRIADNHVGDAASATWTLYFPWDGRCWYLQPQTTHPHYDLGYLDFNSAEGLVAIMEQQVGYYKHHAEE